MRYWSIAGSLCLLALALFLIWGRQSDSVAHTPGRQDEGERTTKVPVEVPTSPDVRIPDPWPNGMSPKTPRDATSAPRGQEADSDGRRRSRSVEVSGPDLSKASPVELIGMMIEAKNAESWTYARAAWELGNRCIYDGWQPNPEQRLQIDALVDRLLDEKYTAAVEGYANARDNLYRLWFLAHPALLRALDPKRKNLDIVVKTLAVVRNRELIAEMLRQYGAETDPQRKRLLAFSLSCMKEQRAVIIPRRDIMGVAESAALYEELIDPVLCPRPRP